jgi:glycosyltransferase involved in cell wall biosynthesis
MNTKNDTTSLCVMQVLPALISGGVERGTIDIAQALIQNRHKAIVVSSGGPMVKQLEQIGAIHIKLPVQSKNLFALRKNAIILKKLILEHKVDIIHARSRAPAWSCYWATRKLNIPYITTFHGTYSHQNRFKKWYNTVMLRSDKTIAVSHFIADHVQRIYLNSHLNLHLKNTPDIQVIHRGIDTEKFNPEAITYNQTQQLKQQWGIPENKIIIMLPARVTPWKGHAVFIDAISRLPSNNFICLMVGDDQGKDAYREALDCAIKVYNLEKKFKFVGACNDMPTAYKLADIVVSASTDPEAFGRVACEAQAMDCLVVATNHGGSLETIAPSQQMLLCAPNNAISMTQAIEAALLIKPEQAIDIQIQSRKHIEEHFSLNKMCSDTLALYLQQVGNKKTGAQA